jgi:hypothetical protein
MIRTATALAAAADKRRCISMRITALIFGLSLPGCAGNQQALVASGGERDSAAMGRISEEWGTAESDATVPIMVGDQEYAFRVWIHKSKPKIMAQTGSLAATAAAGFVRGLTLGIMQGDQEYQPFQDAAMSYLNANRGPGCILHNSRRITRIGFEWDFDCPDSAPATKRSPRSVSPR